MVSQRVASVRARESQEVERVLRDGTVVAVSASFTPDGSMVSTYADVTAARQAEAALRASQRRLAMALQASGLGLWEIDLQTGSVYLSGGCSRLLNFANLERTVDPREVQRFFPASELPRVMRERRKLLKGEIERLALEHQMYTADGALIWLLTGAQVIERGADGRALKVVGASKNITDWAAAGSVDTDLSF